MAIIKLIDYKRNNKDSGREIALNSVPGSEVFYSSEFGSGERHMKYDSVSHHTANRPGNYHCRGKKQFQAKEDFIRKKKNIHSFLRGNIQPTEECRFITLKINDRRVKRVNTAQKKGIDYCKSLPGIVHYIIMVELNYKHHPHIHIILRVKHKLADSVYKTKWNQGPVEVQQLDGNWQRLCNYLIKVPKTNNFSFNEKEAEKLIKKEELLSKQLQGLVQEEKRVSTKSAKSRIRDLYRDKNNLKKKVHSYLKCILQYQLCVGDSNVSRSYGSGNNEKKIPNKEHKTEKELLNDYDDTGAIYDHTDSFFITYIDDSTGEILNKSKSINNVYISNK